jgi:hypothetical protein
VPNLDAFAGGDGVAGVACVVVERAAERATSSASRRARDIARAAVGTGRARPQTTARPDARATASTRRRRIDARETIACERSIVSRAIDARDGAMRGGTSDGNRGAGEHPHG